MEEKKRIACMKCGKPAKQGQTLNSNQDGSFVICDDCMWGIDTREKEFTKEELKFLRSLVRFTSTDILNAVFNGVAGFDLEKNNKLNVLEKKIEEKVKLTTK